MNHAHPALSADACYAALSARDARFDGRFFVGVSTTGIYCRARSAPPARPDVTTARSIRPKPPLKGRVSVPACAAARNWLPARLSVDAHSRLATLAADLMATGALAEDGVAGLAAQLGVSERHLRRVIEAEFGVSPVQLAQTQRLLLAKAPADRHRPAGGRSGVRGRLFQPAAVQRTVAGSVTNWPRPTFAKAECQCGPTRHAGLRSPVSVLHWTGRLCFSSSGHAARQARKRWTETPTCEQRTLA